MQSLCECAAEFFIRDVFRRRGVVNAFHFFIGTGSCIDGREVIDVYPRERLPAAAQCGPKPKPEWDHHFWKRASPAVKYNRCADNAGPDARLPDGLIAFFP